MGRDETGTLTALKDLRREVVDPLIAAHGGRIVKTTGDGLLLEFPSVVDAVRCVVEVQTTMAERTAAMQEDRRIAFRIGVNVGDIIFDDGDIFGDGVNVAARLQEIASPGGICLSGRAHEDIRDRLDIVFAGMGEQSLKNIARPVAAFGWSPEATAPTAETPALALPDKPSIAVLPFHNMSGDPEQQYFVDGLAEEIITALARFKSLFVIARNSSFAYKGKSPDIRQVGRELGVRYALEGSVRKASDRVRITTQLVDTASGAHTWVERFEGTLNDVFVFQDEVTEKVVASIAPWVLRAEVARAKRRSSSNTDAYDCYLRGLACLSPPTTDNMNGALRLFTQASALDPDYASAYAMSMWCHSNLAAGGAAKDIAWEKSEVARLWRIVTRVGQENCFALAHAAWAAAYILHDIPAAKQLIDRSVELNPNLAGAWSVSGWINVWLGQPDVALGHLGRAKRLDPGSPLNDYDPPMAHAYFFLDRYEEAVAVAEQMLRHNPDQSVALRIGAASAAFAGRNDVSRRMAGHLLQVVDPAFRVSRLKEYLGPYQRPELVEKYAEGLRKAGLPE